MRTLVATVGMLLFASSLALAKPTADESQAAREHYKRGTTLYDLGKYDEAILEFQQAYEIKDDPVLLYNIAQSFRLSNKYNEALRFYRTYLRRAPKAPNRDEVETKIADMENLIQQQNKVATTPSPDVVPPAGSRSSQIGAKPVGASSASTSSRTTSSSSGSTEPRSASSSSSSSSGSTEPTSTSSSSTGSTEPTSTTDNKPEGTTDNKPAGTTENKDATTADSGGKGGGGKMKLIAGVAIAAVGVVLLGTGIALGAVASGDSSKESAAATFDPAIDSQGRTFGLVGPILMGVGGVALAAGVVVAVLGVMGGKKEEPKVSLLPVLGPNNAGASLSLRF